MKNPHRVEPTRYRKKRESTGTIDCDPKYGPLFGSHGFCDICIGDRCKSTNSCWIDTNDSSGYEYHPQYKASLFVKTAEPDYTNFLSVSDYEVFTF